MTLSITELTQAFELKHLSTITGIKRGIERETLRIQSNGQLSTQPHNKELGSALTHPYITTDYSESLLEFITPATHSIEDSLDQLKDIQKYTLENIEGDFFWPMSMPCIVENEDDIKIAQYGSSNVGRMKTVYRQGLKNRYGSLMQVIAGIHFNFSFSLEFFKALQQELNSELPLQDFMSDRYFALIRNYKRYGWMIPYLFGSSPALCPSFLQGKEHKLPFKVTPKGCYYLEHATSLRMSDLGYTNSSQSSLQICNNSVESYVECVQKAISLPSEEFAKIGVNVDGEYQQLNSNILQIENELYAPIRPKRVAKSGQKPSEALKEGGVEYIEVRAMDVNPFVSTGISSDQMHFLDVFITFCLLKDSPLVSPELKQVFTNNTNKVILEGRKPGLTLADGNTDKTIPEWGKEIFAELEGIAKMFDKAYGVKRYSAVVATEYNKILNPNNTPSAQIIDDLLTKGKGIIGWAKGYAQQFKEDTEQHQYKIFDREFFQKMAQESFVKQQQIEDADTESFDEFLDNYFKNIKN